jgi:hypothetical protein
MEPSTRPRALSLPGAANLSLRARLLALLCAAALLPMALIGILESRAASSSLTGDRRAELAKAAEEVGAAADRILSERHGDTQAFAASEAARSMDPERIARWMDTAMAAYAPSYRMMAVADRRGRLVVARAVDDAGRPVGSADDLTGLDVGDQAWFQAAAGGRTGDTGTFLEDAAPDPLVDRLGGPDARTSASPPRSRTPGGRSSASGPAGSTSRSSSA